MVHTQLDLHQRITDSEKFYGEVVFNRHKFLDTSFKNEGLVSFLLHEGWTERPSSNEQITAEVT